MSFIEISWRDEAVSIEYEWVGHLNSTQPILVFFHEGLGSISMWKDFPATLCNLLGLRGLVYSRPAYGNSTPKSRDIAWENDFLHQQAIEVFPELLSCLGIKEPVYVIGHSDGGTIALLIAAHLPHLVSAVAVIAPHIFVEDITIQGIEEAKVQYLKGPLKTTLARYHQDVDSVFWGWNDIWLKPDFREFDITSELGNINCPLIAIQGSHDPYGTMAQVEEIPKFVKQARVVEIPECGHSVHRDSPIILFKVLQDFFRSI